MSAVLALGFWPLTAVPFVPAQAYLAQALLQQSWKSAEGVTPNNKASPWQGCLPMARLRADRVAIDLIVLAGSDARTLEFGPGLLLAGAPPGMDGNTIIAGYRDTHFAFLKDLRIADQLVIEEPCGEEHIYIVDRTEVVKGSRALLTIDTDEPRLTLVTGYPFDDGDEDEDASDDESAGQFRYLVGAFGGQ